MPEEDGIATIRRMLSERPGTKIVAISGGGRVGNIDFLKLARKMGASEALPKPFERESLLAIVSAHLKDG